MVLDTAEPTDLSKELFPWMKRKDLIRISNYLNIHLITFMDVSTRDEALSALVDELSKAEAIADKDLFFKAIMEREKIVSTGIGMGVAIPHAKLASLKKFFICVGIQKEKAIEWNSIDKTPVRLIFMIGGPEDKQNEYLQILSHLTKIIKDESLRKKIITAASKEQVLKLLSTY
jgi:nitrogen PTS system EIIA component